MPQRPFVQDLGAAAATALAWIAAFHLNEWLFASLALTSYVSLIFLPAGIRVLSVLLLGRPAVLGLFVGVLVIATPHWQLPAALVPAVISCLAPAVAVAVATRSMALRDDLAGITLRQMAIMAALEGAINSVASNLFFWLDGRIPTPWKDVWPMFTGDLLGTILLLYASAFALRLLLRLHRPRG